MKSDGTACTAFWKVPSEARWVVSFPDDAHGEVLDKVMEQSSLKITASAEHQLHTCEHGERARRPHTERSYLSCRLLTNPWPCVKKTTANKLQSLTRERAQFPVPSNE